MNKETLIETVAKEQRENLPPDWEVPVHLDMVSLFVVIGAMHHPQFKKTPSAGAARCIIDLLISGIPENCPALKELARLGGLFLWIGRLVVVVRRNFRRTGLRVGRLRLGLRLVAGLAIHARRMTDQQQVALPYPLLQHRLHPGQALEAHDYYDRGEFLWQSPGLSPR